MSRMKEEYINNIPFNIDLEQELQRKPKLITNKKSQNTCQFTLDRDEKRSIMIR